MSRAQPVQHHLRRQNRCQWIRLVFTRMFRRAAVNRFEHRVLIADVTADREAETTRRSCTIVADDVADEIWTNDDVVPFGIANLPLAESVDVSIVEFQIGKFALANFAEYFAKKAVRADDV